jgi:hypothetical protein
MSHRQQEFSPGPDRADNELAFVPKCRNEIICPELQVTTAQVEGLSAISDATNLSQDLPQRHRVPFFRQHELQMNRGV